ncbi:MAG: PKD domain-containing protein, partial [Candidatus Neomarinimicrobiota bacterium]
TYTVGLRVTAASGLTGTMATTAEVINLPPVVNAGPNQEVIKGVPTTFGGSFSDPGWLDNHVIEWNFGDGESASGTLTPTHTYSLPDVYSVTLTVTDDDSGVGSETLTVTVGDPFFAYLPLVLK